VFYYLGELNDALSYALGAGPLFDVSEDTDYAHTLLGLLHILTSFLLSVSKLPIKADLALVLSEIVKDF
jgi:hypothetical protein